MSVFVTAELLEYLEVLPNSSMTFKTDHDLGVIGFLHMVHSEVFLCNRRIRPYRPCVSPSGIVLKLEGGFLF